MKKYIIGLIIAYTLITIPQVYGQGTVIRPINFAGLIVDAKTMLPVEAAKIFNDDNQLLGVTDKNGYYKIKLEYSKTGPIKFSLKITKGGFASFTQRENWGNLPGGTQTIMYFGLSRLPGAGIPFSEVSNSANVGNYLTYNNVLQNFAKVKEQKNFDEKLLLAKAGNQKVFLNIEDNYYIANNSGWIKLGSATDSVSVDHKKAVPANTLNDMVKRKDVKWMTPLNTREKGFAIYTKAVK
ncbi:hypothetical protein [Mucilaginibacter sp. FT3.2]|uniref:hypothetical protein n=1 Tax=Mucilaginibacter sp. FT3.2 TaxID=2723090 RepID=UPI00161B75EF|nr:hypothetical protein [Mucilaginibacter sp. FT3.2]MBB6231734.1 hypothetical protein [Mucilaginibacter sp. FT3.2]